MNYSITSLKKNKMKKNNSIDEEFIDDSELFQENFDRNTRTVFLFDDIDGISSLKCMKALMILDRSDGDINLIINSEGGSTVDGWGIVDFILQMRNSVHGIVYGGAFSMASVILQACKTRKMTKHSTMMVHAGSVEMDSDTNSAILNAEYLKKDLDITMDFYRSRARISPKKMKELMSQDTFLAPLEALRYGFIDGII